MPTLTQLIAPVTDQLTIWTGGDTLSKMTNALAGARLIVAIPCGLFVATSTAATSPWLVTAAGVIAIFALLDAKQIMDQSENAQKLAKKSSCRPELSKNTQNHFERWIPHLGYKHLLDDQYGQGVLLTTSIDNPTAWFLKKLETNPLSFSWRFL